MKYAISHRTLKKPVEWHYGFKIHGVKPLKIKQDPWWKRIFKKKDRKYKSFKNKEWSCEVMVPTEEQKKIREWIEQVTQNTYED